jgi:L-threonylcarbamoyladenylate synthase
MSANTFHLSRAVRALHDGGVIAYPTEAVWGLGCDPFNDVAALRLLALKQRDWRKGMILVAADIAQLTPFLYGLEAQHLQTLKASWPGPNTWLLPNNGAAPDWVTGGRETLAVRVSNHPTVAALCNAFGGPVVSTSANPAGKPPARSALSVRRYFDTQLDDILPGKLGGQRNPTRIRFLLSGEVARHA